MRFPLREPHERKAGAGAPSGPIGTLDRESYEGKETDFLRAV
jgi:hypothetical protein